MPKGESPNSRKNLKPIPSMTEKEQREFHSKGGKASVKARQEKKTIRQYIEVALEELKTNKHGRTATAKEIIAIRQVQDAMLGIRSAVDYVTEMIGEKPINKQEISISQPIDFDIEKIKEANAKIDNALCENS